MRDHRKENLKAQKKRTLYETLDKVGISIDPMEIEQMTCKQLQFKINDIRREFQL